MVIVDVQEETFDVERGFLAGILEVMFYLVVVKEEV